MFQGASVFNQDISSWDVGSVTNMNGMFYDAKAFNQDINSWNVGNVTNMGYMFQGATVFNQPLNNWDVSKVKNFSYAFKSATAFNQPLNSWDVSNVTNMSSMFFYASSFNQDVSSWDVSTVTQMVRMFYNANTFNQDISSWNVSSVEDMNLMLDNSDFSISNYDVALINWSQQAVQPEVKLGALGINYCDGADARQNLIDTHGWVITDAGLDCSTASVEDQNQLNITIYPNPSSDRVYIEGNYSQLKAVVYDILGKQVIKESITNSIDISQLEKGVYILQLSDGAKLTTERILKN
jgi:surface protein